MSNLHSYVWGLRLVLLLDHPQCYHARQYIGHEGGSISIALPPTTMLPTSIATLTGRNIFFHIACKGNRHQHIDNASTSKNQDKDSKKT